MVKPGEYTNRGFGIRICTSIAKIKREVARHSEHYSLILQEYITPFLIHQRKFDIRCFAMVTSFNGVVQGYFYPEGYLRTASKPFSLDSTSKFIHLTNDAVQQHSEDYGKFENGNKLSYGDFQRYLDSTENPVSFTETVLPQIKHIIKDSIQAVYLKLDPLKRSHTFEILGYDFILDSGLVPWLLEVNTNPCLELSSVHLARIIPALIENSFRITLDALFPEPSVTRKTNTAYEPFLENKYELIFHSQKDGEELLKLLKDRNTVETTTLVHPEVDELSEEDWG